MKLTLTNDDNSTQDFFPQSYTDAAVAAALAAVPPTPSTTTVTEVDVKESDGSEETFVPPAPPVA